ncbi:Hypothetical predicted protein [Pelobates cultripes]|uniref:Uncharacterized protein n=1 Tax=Pelobates cultripes TaxID=61616 RepID=A0AAD1RH06_PELCU|nr:Hypothetical predicted protein [Pelobates cultripes]CAH2253306.1 Hypothetical predicted protein [Pelobates cultripes]
MDLVALKVRVSKFGSFPHRRKQKTLILLRTFCCWFDLGLQPKWANKGRIRCLNGCYTRSKPPHLPPLRPWTETIASFKTRLADDIFHSNFQHIRFISTIAVPLIAGCGSFQMMEALVLASAVTACFSACRHSVCHRCSNAWAICFSQKAPAVCSGLAVDLPLMVILVPVQQESSFSKDPSGLVAVIRLVLLCGEAVRHQRVGRTALPPVVWHNWFKAVQSTTNRA